MSDTDTIRPGDQWPDRELTEAQQRNRDSAALIPVARSGVIPMNFAQMVDYAKFMSQAKGAVGAHLMGNVGACLAVMEIANQFGMPAYAVARQSYLVNGRVAFMGQFFHAIIEDYAPLKKGPNGRKLQFRYEGDGETLKIIVAGTYVGATAPVEYESPMWKDLTVKNSPLWKTEPKRQFQFFAVRGWQTVNWPEGMLHAISTDEAEALPPSEYARDITPIANTEGQALRERLTAAQAATPEAEREGFKPGFTEGHFTEVGKDPAKADAGIDAGLAAAAGEAKQAPADDDGAKVAKPKAPSRKTTKAAKPDKKDDGAFPGDKQPAGEAEVDLPKTPGEWVTFARAWLAAEPDADNMRARWAKEQKLRNDCGVTSEDRDPVFEFYQQRLSDIEAG